ncbi:MAG: nidogen-like domain-containing protein [Chloroflexota bacterium]
MDRSGIAHSLEHPAARAALLGVRARTVGIVVAFLFGVLAPVGLAPAAVQASEHCSSGGSLAANDDGSTALVDIGFTLDYFGTDYSALHVNNNGNVTFTAPLGQFTPEPIVGVGIPIIAPFWADVDTRAEASAIVTFGQTVVGDRDAFCVAWDGVGYFNTHGDKLNDFELLLIDRSDVAAGDFDIVFTYTQIEWETGDASGGEGGLGGTSARAGYSNGDSETPETSLELPGSAVNGAFLDSNLETGLIHNSRNSEVDGTYIFPVRNGEPPQPEADLAVSQTDDPDPVASGGQVTYEITVTNNGPDVATSITLDDTLPAGSTFVSALSESGECVEVEGAVSCDLGSLEPEGTALVTLVVDAPEVETTTVITNSATASADQFDPVETNDTSDEETTVEVAAVPTADLSVTQTDEPDPVTAGNGVEYLVTVTNNGPDTATEVTLVDTIPEGSTLIAVDDEGCSVEGDTVTCDLGSLGPEGGSASVSIVVGAPTVSSETTMTNSATATAAEFDPNAADNTSDEVTTIQPAPSDPDVATGFVSDEGGTVSTGAGKGPSKKDPMTTAVTVPPGFPGVVTIVEGPITSCAPGFTCFGQEANITAPETTTDTPLELTFRFHESTVKTGRLATIVMFHDNVLVPRCTGPAGVAQPDPCISSVSLVRGVVNVVVLSSENGTWRGGR